MALAQSKYDFYQYYDDYQAQSPTYAGESSRFSVIYWNIQNHYFTKRGGEKLNPHSTVKDRAINRYEDISLKQKSGFNYQIDACGIT
ncbi:hypothetical protein MHK_010167 [Candidatus Magnetomorum sp. HK-1]|nr:hypothetical protein MHK_010167 [Candidatus Magnetomorum sp. HK-1]